MSFKTIYLRLKERIADFRREEGRQEMAEYEKVKKEFTPQTRKKTGTKVRGNNRDISAI